MKISKVVDVLKRDIVSTGNSAKVGCPAKYRGYKAYVLILPKGVDNG